METRSMRLCIWIICWTWLAQGFLNIHDHSAKSRCFHFALIEYAPRAWLVQVILNIRDHRTGSRRIHYTLLGSTWRAWLECI